MHSNHTHRTRFQDIALKLNTLRANILKNTNKKNSTDETRNYITGTSLPDNKNAKQKPKTLNRQYD